MKKKLLEQLYMEYADSLRLYIYSICRDFGVAEELMQETFVKAMISLSDSHHNVKAWLFMVGKNLSLNRLKREKRIKLTDDDKHMSEPDNTLPMLIENEKNRRLYQAMLGLPEKMKEILILHYFSEMTFGQIAEVLGISPGSARNLAYRARLLLRKELEDKDDF